MIRKVYTIVFLLVCFIGESQKLSSTLLSANSVLCETYVGFDTLGDNYFITDNVFIKKSSSQTWNYKNVVLGKITSVDIINPLQIVLFYEDFNTAILLDNQLNEVQKINFSSLEIPIIASNVKLSGRNKLWVFNTINQKLGLFDTTKNTNSEFPIPVQGTIVQTQSDFNTFYWIDDLNNCYSCSIFGTVTLLCNVPAFDTIQIIDKERILFSVTNKLYLLNYAKKSIFEIEIVENSFKKFYYKDQILAIFTDQEIKKFKINLP
ncbi:hypothetical protein [Flavobacterium sp.]